MSEGGSSSQINPTNAFSMLRSRNSCIYQAVASLLEEEPGLAAFDDGSFNCTQTNLPYSEDAEVVSPKMQEEEPGLAVFDGGSFSRGPMQLGEKRP